MSILPKGKPWTREEERTVIQLVKKRKEVDVIAKVLGKNEDMTHHKMRRLDLRVEEGSEKDQLSTSSRRLPEELPSIENVMKRLTIALVALERARKREEEIIRLRCLIQGFNIYKELFANYVHYREIETELIEMRRGYEELVKKAEHDAAKPTSR
jgi:hypothetical protein